MIADGDLESARPPLTVGLPVMTVDADAIENNVALMAGFASAHNCLLAPHVKSHMTTELMKRQLRAGAWGLTAATLRQADAARRAGAQRILIANQVVGENDARRLAQHLRDDIDVLCLVDDPRGVALLDSHLGNTDLTERRLGVLVELGSEGGRAGARTLESAVAAARAVVNSDHLELRGVETYEGLVGHDASPAAIQAVDRQLGRLLDLLDSLTRSALFPDCAHILVSAGASRYADRVVRATHALRDREGIDILMRPGTYVTYGDPGDDAVFATLIGSPDAALVGALTIWAQVLSCPEAGLAIVGIGKRDIGDRRAGIRLRTVASASNDPARPFRGSASVAGLDDQHCYLRYTADDLAIGDALGFTVRHPWSLDQWRGITAFRGNSRTTQQWLTEF